MAEGGLPKIPEFNVAEGKTAFQTSTQAYHTPSTGEQYPGEARLAIDGDTNGNHWDNSCSHTKGEANPAWVVIFNRQDCCSERLNPFNIHIGDSSQVTLNSKCGGDHQIDLSQPSISVSCPGMTGRYVGVRLPGSSRSMSLCEVQVFSNGGPSPIADVPQPSPTSNTPVGVNVAQGKTAYQTTTSGYWIPSTGEVFSGEARLAVDGNTNGDHGANSCTHTKGEGANDAWWVDLGRSYMINSVVIYNRLDCCSERLNPFNIHIGDYSQITWNPKCGGDHLIDLSQPSISVSCPGMTGRYVGVRLIGSSRAMSLCEVQVFSNAG
ncbi:uncharacterized protein [Branchiostoma lanceolatum]|uniref:uncharacterized protein n=1 Tax=Branchiostoma lanceolatum TaxID=7740 RepID=UPI003456C861